MATKFHDDKAYKRKNSFYAKVGGITLEEMNNLEKQFLFGIDYRLSIEEEQFKYFKLQIMNFGKQKMV